MKTPWLIQRAKSQEFNPSMRTGEYLRLDYMGSAEFEFGAIPAFQRVMKEKLNSMVVSSVEHNGTKLFYVSTKDQVEQYANILKDLIENKTRLKERSGLTDKEVLYVGKKQTPVYDAIHAPYSYDVWLDLTNGLMFARTEEVLKRLFVTVINSVHYMDQQKKAR